MAHKKESEIAHMLNEATSCGFNDVENLAEVLTDYFGDRETSDSDSDSSDEEPMDTDSDDPFEQRNVGEDGNVEEADEVALAMAHVNDDDEPQVFERNCQCKCKIFNGSRCIEQFTDMEQDEIRLNTSELTDYEKDLILIGMIAASVSDSEMTQRSKQKSTKRLCTRVKYFHFGSKRVCHLTFRYLMQISKDKYTNLKAWYKENGLVPRKKKSGGRREKRCCSIEDIQNVVKFICNYAEVHSMLLPGRTPGVNNFDKVKLLPSNLSKAKLYRIYRDACGADVKVVGLTTFKNLWRQLLPYIVISKPATDLCWTCQKNNNLIIKQANVPEAQKSAALKKQEDHLSRSMMERSLYRKRCQESKEVVKDLQLKGLSKNQPNSRDATFHYSFDYAQQVHYPCDPLQPGPIFFKTCRKCSLFGIHAEGFSSQVNYLTDECITTRKGSNQVISYLHHFFENYGIGEKHLILNADNCQGQNKNNIMMRYLMWRVENGLNSSIIMSFLCAGHTKFSPDWCFGLVKRQYRRTFVSSLQDIANVVLESSTKGSNTPCLVGDESGKSFVPFYAWDDFFNPHFKPLVGIKSLHHFRIDQNKPGCIFVKEWHDSEEREIKLLKSKFPTGMPDKIPPQGLTDARKQYLYDEIREFCREDTRDVVCPDPQ